MTDLLVVPAKKGSDVDLTGPLTNWIKSTFGAENGADSVSDIASFQKLRQTAIRPGDRGENAALACSNYYDQLVGIQNKVPVNEVQIPFKWKDAFDKGSFFGGRISLTIPSFSYEKVCVLFNVAAYHSIVAAEQSFDSDDGLQKALKKLQLISGIFANLKETAVVAIQRDPTPDLDPETLGILSDLMLAQAQEMIVIKSMKDNMKDAIVAKLCSQCEDMYANVMKSIQKESVRNLWDSSWAPNIFGKQAIYNGLAQYFQSRVCNADKAVGEEIARLQYAIRLFKAGIERSGLSDLCNAADWTKRCERALTEAKKDNDFIYHERIPDEKNLAPIKKAAVAKITPLPSKLGSDQDKILFDSLCPLAVHQALGSFETRKKELVKKELDRLQEATNLANASMSSMNLPASLEITKGKEIPQSLRDKSQAVINAGGPDAIKKMIHELPELLTRNTELLDECDRLLREERESDEQLRNQFKEKWTRTSSDKLTGSFNSNAQKYRTIINNAKDADKVVRDKFESHTEYIALLAQGSNNMENKMPGASGSSSGDAISNSPNVAKLKALCENVETLKAERQAIEAEIKSTNPDMKNIFLSTHAGHDVINEEEMSKETLNRAFSGLIEQVNDSVQRQEGILKEMTDTNEKFLGEKGGNDNGNARDDMLKKLAAGHDAFFELQKHLQEGTKFYNDLTQLLVTFQNKVSDYCFARKTEKDELMKDLTAGLSQMDLNQTASSIAAPAHHTPASAASVEPPKSPTRPPRAKDVPPRPPPPTQVSQTPSTEPAAGSTPGVYPGGPASAPNPYAGAPTASAPNPYAGAPVGQPPAPGAPPTGPGYPPYVGTVPPAQAPLPYPTQPNMPMPYQPYAYPPQAGYPQQQPPAYYPGQGQPPPYAGYGQQPYYPPPPQGGQPPQPPQYYPPQNPGQQPQWR